MHQSGKTKEQNLYARRLNATTKDPKTGQKLFHPKIGRAPNFIRTNTQIQYNTWQTKKCILYPVVYKYILVQRIPTISVVDIESFTIEGVHYLAFAQESSSARQNNLQLVHELGVDGIVHCICVSSKETTTQAVFSFPTFTKISVLYFDPVSIDGISFKANKPRPVTVKISPI